MDYQQRKNPSLTWPCQFLVGETSCYQVIGDFIVNTQYCRLPGIGTAIETLRERYGSVEDEEVTTNTQKAPHHVYFPEGTTTCVLPRSTTTCVLPRRHHNLCTSQKAPQLVYFPEGTTPCVLPRRHHNLCTSQKAPQLVYFPEGTTTCVLPIAGQIQIGPDFLQSSFSILEDQPMDMLLGLDMLKRHQVCR